MAVDTILHGRWLHFGATHQSPGLAPGRYSAADWEHWCALAAEWGMTGVHPKVAEGTYLWYDDAEMAMLKTIANKHHLLIVPYHYVYGETFGYAASVTEAQHIAHIGKLFGCVVLDMESQWSNKGGWVQPYANNIRAAGYTGHLIPTTFANPAQHGDIPYIQINHFLSSAWMPQVYFDLWTTGGHKMSASEAIHYVYPQWLALDTECRKYGKPLAPVLPIIDLYGKPPTGEVTEWLREMHGYGYCGFWYADVYAPYAATVQQGVFPGSLPPALAPVAPVVAHLPVAIVPPKAKPVLPPVEPVKVIAKPPVIIEPATAIIPAIPPLLPSPPVVVVPTTVAVDSISEDDAWLNSPPSSSPLSSSSTSSVLPSPPAESEQDGEATQSSLPMPVTPVSSLPAMSEVTVTPLPITAILPIPPSPSLPEVVSAAEPVNGLAINLTQLFHMEVVGSVLYVFYRGTPIQELRPVGAVVETALANHEPMSAMGAKLDANANV